jgi:GBP family porin
VGLPTQPAVDLVTTQLGMTYRFDALKLHGYVIRVKPEGAPGMKGGMLGVSVPVGVGEIASSIQRRNAEDAANSDAQTVALQYSHYLSKRTTVYVGGAKQTNKGNASFGVWPSRLEAGLTPAGADVTGFQLGMRHYF